MMADKSIKEVQQNIEEIESLRQKLQESDERYYSLVTALTQIVWTVNCAGSMEGQMDAWRAYTGWVGERVSYRDMLAAVHPKDRLWVEQSWQKALICSRPYEIIYRLRRYDGVYRRFSVRAVPVWDGHGKVSEWMHIGTDVDAQTRAEQVSRSGTPSSVASVLVEQRVIDARRFERQRLLRTHDEAQMHIVALHEMNQRMEEFIGTASHELRTPLTAIKVNVQLAMRRLKSALKLMDAVEPEATEKVAMADELMRRAERQIGVLSQLVSDMVDISRIQANRFESYLHKEPCDLREIVERTVSEQQKVYAERTIHRELPASESVPVCADAGRIAQVVNSYLSNALKYSAAERCIDVVLTSHDGWVRVEVRDQGQGLSEEEQRRVWECFYQCPRIRVLSGSGVGLGLGLYISETIIALHQGHIGVESAPDQGSTFWFELPMARVEEC